MPISLGRHSYFVGKIRNDFDVHVDVGKFTSIAANCVILGGSGQHPYATNRRTVTNYPFPEMGWGAGQRCGGRGPVVIGSDVWIGFGVTILDGIRIGDGAVVGAGCVVATDIQPYAVVAGNPMRILRFRFDAATIERLLAIAWWNWPDQRIREFLPHMSDIERFLALCSANGRPPGTSGA